MTVSATWVSPAPTLSMDLTTGGVLTETWCDAVASNFLVLGGLDGHTMSAVTISGGGLNVAAGNVGIGGAPVPQFGLSLPNTLAMNTGTTQAGISVKSQGNSVGTVEYSAFLAQATTVALAYTCTTVCDFHALTPVKGATSTITSAYGLLVDVINAGNVNNIGVYVNPPTGGSNLNVGVYIAGGGLTVASGNTAIQSLQVAGNIGFYGQGLITKQTITGAKGGNAALSSLLGGLASLGLLNDATTA